MNQTKPLGRWCPGKVESPRLTPRTFVRAAGLTNLLIGALCVVEFCALAVAFHDSRTLLLGLVLLSLMTLAIWTTAAALGGLALFPGWLWVSVRRHARRTRSSPLGRSGVWDGWLDGPARP
jgi:hypothetical protein